MTVNAEHKIFARAHSDYFVERPEIDLVRENVGKWLKLSADDLDIVDIALGTLVANRGAGDPVWLLIVAPPSSAKSEILRATKGLPDVHSLSALTGKTLISGMKGTAGGNRSLLLRLKAAGTRTVVLKDFGTVLSANPNEKAEVLAQLREIYDGHFLKEFGTGESVEWQGTLGLLAGVTPVIEKHYAVMGELGDRFLLVRLHPSSRLETARRSLDNSGHEEVMRKEIHEQFVRIIKATEIDSVARIEASNSFKDSFASMAEVATRLRSPVSRDGYNRSLDYLPEPEGTPRFTKALFQLARGIAAVRGKREISDAEMCVAARICADSIPSTRLRAVAVLYRALVESVAPLDMGWRKTSDVASIAGIPWATAKMILEDLFLLKVCSRDLEDAEDDSPNRERRSFQWRLTAKTRSALERSGISRLLEQHEAKGENDAD